MKPQACPNTVKTSRTSCPNTNIPTRINPKPAARVSTGTVVAVSPEQVFVDIGQKIEGVMPLAEFKDASGTVSVRVGDQFPVSIKGRNEEGYYELSKVQGGAAQGLVVAREAPSPKSAPSRAWSPAW